MGEQPERVLALDDRQHLELAVLADQVCDGRVTGLVGGDGAPLVLGVLDRLLQADLLGHLRLLDVVPVERVGAAAQRPDQCLVEQVLDHDGRVAEGHRGQRVATRGLVELDLVRLLCEVVVDDLAPSATAREVEVDRAVEAARAQERGVEVGRAVGGPDHQDVRRLRTRRVDLSVRGHPAVDPVDGPVAQALAAGRRVERLELDEQLVHHARDALAPGRRPHAGARRPDGIDLLDEPDGATLLPGRLAQGLEVGADLAVGLAVVHRLEGRRRHEQERHLGLPGHGLGHVGLARPRRPLEEDGPAGGAAHPLLERLVGQEQVEALHDLLDDDRHPLHVGQRRLDLARPVQHVGGPAGPEQRQQDGRPEDHHEDQQRQGLGDRRGEVGPGGEGRLAVEHPVPHPDADEPHQEGDAAQSALPGTLPGAGDVGGGTAEDAVLLERLQVHYLMFGGRTAQQLRALRRERGGRAAAQGSKRYPTPRTVVIQRGLSGSSSILRRRRRTCSVMVASDCQSDDDSHTCWRSCSRVKTWRGEPARKASRSNSLAVISTFAPPTVTSRVWRSMASPSKVRRLVAPGAARCRARRRTDSMRADSSAAENGFTT